MSVTYIYAVDSAGDLTSAGTSSTSGNTLETNELMWVTSGTTVTLAVLETSAVSLTGSGTAVTNPGGSTWAYNGGSITASGQHITQPLTGGAALIDNGATLISATVDPGAGVLVLSGGTTSSTVLEGGYETVTSGGTAVGTITSGGNQNLYAGATGSATLINSGGGQEIYSGGVSDAATIGGFGIQDVWAGGTANSATINNGGVQIVHAGGGSYSTENIAGQTQVFGFDLSGTVTATGVMEVMSGGNAQSTFLTSGGSQIVSAGGSTTGINLEILGTQTVASGGTANNTFLTGGNLYVQSGGLAATPVLNAGEVVVSAGGVVSGANAYEGTLQILKGGVANASVLSGGLQIVMGGTANNTLIMSGGAEVVVSGTSNNPIIYAGGSETVYAGATVNNVEINGAGTLSIETGANVGGPVLFGAEGGRLQLIGTTLPAITIDGLAAGDSIDLSNLSGTAASYANGTLTVTGANGTVASLSLGTAPDGTYTVASDGHGGTLITLTAFTVATALAAYQSNALPGGAAILDSAANVSANIDTLETVANAGKLVGIALTDSGTPAITVTAAQLSADSKALADISGNFTLDVSASSSATITGLSGHATVVEFSGASTQYTVTASNGTITVSNGSGLTDQITSVTALHFSDTTEVVATATHIAGSALSSLDIAELYGAALNRAPDVGGLTFFETLIASNPTMSYATLAADFLNSTEYTAAHNYAQTSAGDTQFINDLYTNVLHRTGSSTEVAFYQNVINGFLTGQTAGTAAYTAAELQAHIQVLHDFAASTEYRSDIQITAQNPASASHWLLLI